MIGSINSKISEMCMNDTNYMLNDMEFSSIGNRRTVFDFKANNIDGFPDGMTIDSEGNLWVAVFQGSQVSCKLT